MRSLGVITTTFSPLELQIKSILILNWCCVGHWHCPSWLCYFLGEQKGFHLKDCCYLITYQVFCHFIKMGGNKGVNRAQDGLLTDSSAFLYIHKGFHSAKVEGKLS